MKRRMRMFKNTVDKIYRKLKKYFFGRRRLGSFLIISLLIIIWLTSLLVSLRMSTAISEALKPPLGLLEKDLDHFRRCRNIKHYLDNTDILIEPSSSSLPCTDVEKVPLLVLVVTSAARMEYRHAIRNTWGQHFLTYFVLGVDGRKGDNQLLDNYVEAKQHNDMIVFDFKDHYLNLTIKTGLMIKWTLDRCPQALFLYKVDDDMLVNPWMLKRVLRENYEAKLIGYVNHNRVPHRDETNKWYLPRWLCRDDLILQHLSGGGYIINGEYIRDLLRAANRVPLHNLEDVYFTYHVAQKALGYNITHDARMSPFRIQPSWFPFSYLIPACAYWTTASMHGFNPQELVKFYSYIRSYSVSYDQGKQDDSICYFYNVFIKSFFIMM